MPKNHRRSRQLGIIAAIACALILALPIVIPSALGTYSTSSARPSPEPATAIYVTSGLTWEDLTPETTPNLACFADRSGVAAMALTSESVLPTKRQGLVTLRTGTRTPKLPHGTLWNPKERLMVGNNPRITIVSLGDVDVAGSPEAKKKSLAAVDRKFATSAGDCGRIYLDHEGRRAAVASVGHLNPTRHATAAVEAERSYANLATPLQMQAYIDSGWGPALLTSPSTRQPGVVMNVDIPATLTGQDSVGIGRAIEGSPAGGGSPSAAVAHVRDLSITTRHTEDALGIVMGVIGAVLALCGILASPLGSRLGVRIQGTARVALGAGILSIPAGLTSRTLPLGAIVEAGIPAPLALLTYIAMLSTVAGLTLWLAIRALAPKYRLLVPACSALATVALICLDSALGSYTQFTSVMGNQPLYAGRFYGITNHLTGILLASWLLGCGALIHAHPLFTRGTHAGAWRALLVGGTGAAVGIVAIAPGMGADAGSALMYLPAALIGALVVSGIRVRAWHISVALVAGAAVFFGAGYLDYLRPPNSRTHLGAFIAQILSSGPGGGIGGFFAVFADRTRRMLEPLWVYPGVAPAVLAGIAVFAAALRPRSAFATRYPWAWRLRAVGIGAALIGAVTNDTGLVLLAAAAAAGALLSAAIQLSPAPQRSTPPLPRADHSG